MIHNDILQFLSTQGERGNQIVLWLEKRQPEDVELGQVEHVIDYMLSDKAPKRTERATWEQMVKNTEKWTKSLAKKGKNSGEETEEDIKIITCYSTGCLCELTPSYSPFANNYSHGFAHVKTQPNGHYSVKNIQLIDGVIIN